MIKLGADMTGGVKDDGRILERLDKFEEKGPEHSAERQLQDS